MMSETEVCGLIMFRKENFWFELDFIKKKHCACFFPIFVRLNRSVFYGNCSRKGNRLAESVHGKGA